MAEMSGLFPSLSSTRSRASSNWSSTGNERRSILAESSVGGAVLVPVHDVATLNGALPYRHHLRQGGVAENHPSHVAAPALEEHALAGAQAGGGLASRESRPSHGRREAPAFPLASP